MTRKGLIKSTSVIGMATAISRVLGFVRDIVLASFFGTGMAAQAFVVAFRIPNSLRDLVGEGATNSAIVPVLSEYKELKDEKEFIHASRVLFNVFFLILTAVTILGVIFSPLIVRVIAPGFYAEPDKFTLTVRLNRIMFPYLIMIGLTAYAMGVLNSLRRFAAPAFGPALMNVAMIAAALWLCPNMGAMGLAIGVLVGGALQLLLNTPFLYREGINIDFKDGLSHPAVRRIGRLLMPRAIGSAVYQINIFIDTILASLAWIVGAGGIAALYYANRLIQFPLAIFGLALAQAALPKMSREFASNDMATFKETISFSLRMIILIMLPSSVGLAVLGKQIITILFQRGEFTTYSTEITQSALFFYAFGLFAYGGIKLLVTAFYAMHDTMTPVKVAAAAVVINLILNLMLMWPLKLGGLALATSISAIFNMLLLYKKLCKRLGDFGTYVIIDYLVRALIASLIMALFLKFLSLLLPVGSPTGLFVSIFMGTMSFLAAAYVLNIKEIREIYGWIKNIR
ncbi:MAG: murein biosynthesis integral membrane protein MurJ [Candidatus Omnitrophica bacterium]|nr:murein biosynthesis integral membrane protein MurJ [Candidatus Omnitrophota bacterium]MCM8791007.1 murein biosynthesis integral membrane protein MurJ [Candidatus Omnitrophota bacterium]